MITRQQYTHKIKNNMFVFSIISTENEYTKHQEREKVDFKWHKQIDIYLPEENLWKTKKEKKMMLMIINGFYDDQDQNLLNNFLW